MPDLSGLGLLFIIPIFLAAAVVVWLAGARITRYANVISDKTGMGQALVGVLLLGGVTSMPEVAVAVTSSISGNDELAVNSILGGIAMQVAILAIADAMIGRQALTAVTPDPIVILQGGLKVLLLSIVAAAIMVGDTPVLGTGLWMWLLLLVSGASFWILAKAKGNTPWVVNDTGNGVSKEEEDKRAEEAASEDKDKTLGWAAWRAAIAGLVIIIAGYTLSRTGDAIAQQTGLGESFVGAVFLAIATSLPEVSTVFTAVRAGLYTMAISDIFGTNLFDVTLLFVIDIIGGGDAVMNQVGRFSGFAALIGITVTATLLVGLAERRDRTIFRMGYDSAAVLVTYLAGLVVLYFMRSGQ